jgi:type IV secretion system protein TrbD
MTLRTIPIRRAGNRPNLFWGGDRELVLFAGVVAFALVFSAQDWRATGYGIGLWVMALYLFRLMAKADPLMRFVFLRHRRYRTFYAPRSTPFCKNKERK